MEFERINVPGRRHSSVTFKAYWCGEIVALKVSDVAQEPELEQELLAEVIVYNKLKKLESQGWF